MNKTINKLFSLLLSITLISSLFIGFPIETQATENNLSNVKIYAENNNIGKGLTKVVDKSIQNWSFEIWHYSGGYWGNNTCKIMDKDFSKTDGGVADLKSSLTLDTQTFIYTVPANSDLDKAIENGKEVHINLSSGNQNISLTDLYDINHEKLDNFETKYFTNPDGTLLSTDATAQIIKENGIYKIKINVKPILNYYKEKDLSYPKTYGLSLNKWIPFVANGYGYQVYSMWRNNKNIGMAKGWVNQSSTHSLEGMEEGTIHPTMITNNIGQLQRGLKIHVDYQNGKQGWETISDKNDVRIGWYTLKDAGAVGMHFVFPVALDIYVESDAKVVTSYVKLKGVDRNGDPIFEQIDTKVGEIEQNEQGGFIVEDIKEIDAGTAYLNDILTSPKDFTEEANNKTLDWTGALPQTSSDTINASSNDILSYNLAIRTGTLKYIETIKGMNSYEDLADMQNEMIELLEAYYDVNTESSIRESVLKRLNFKYSGLVKMIGLPEKNYSLENATWEMNYAGTDTVKTAKYISDINNVQVETVSETITVNDALSGNGTTSSVELNGNISGLNEDKATLYVRYIVVPERKLRQFVHIYKNGTYATTETTTIGIPVEEDEYGELESEVEIPTVEEADFIGWSTSTEIPMLTNMPSNPKQSGSSLGMVNLAADENLYTEWKKNVLISTPVADESLRVEQWRLSKYKHNIGYSSQAYMGLNLKADNGHATSTLSPSGAYQYNLIQPNGAYTDNGYNPSNQYYNDWLHTRAITQGSYRVTHDNPSAFVDVSGTLNLIKGTKTFGIKAASWLTDSGTKSGLSLHNIETANTPNNYSGNSTIQKSDLLKYGIENARDYTHRYGVRYHWTCHHKYYSHDVCDCYTLPETRNKKSSKITYLTADYNINSTFDRYIAQPSSVLEISPYFTNDNGKTTVTYQLPTELKIYPEVAMLFDNDKGDTSVKWVIGEQARTIKPVTYHTLQFKLFVNENSNASSFATDSRALTARNKVGEPNKQVAYKGTSINTTFGIQRSETNKGQSGLLTVKTFALDVTTNKNGVNVKNAWGLNGYNTKTLHTNFIGKWNGYDGTASERLEVSTPQIVQGGTKTQNVSLKPISYSGSTTVEFTHELIIRGGQLIGVRLQDRDTKTYSLVKISDLQSKDAGLYEALVNMKLIGSKENTVLKGFEHQTGVQLTEQKYIDMVSAAKQLLDGITTNNLQLNKGWYSEDTTVLVIREYVSNYNVPSISFSDKLSLQIAGLNTPIDKSQFFSTLGKGHTVINYNFKSDSIGYGLANTNVYFEHNSRLGSAFGKQKVDYLVANVSITDTTRQ